MTYRPEPEPPSPGFALAKYGIILVIVVVVLWFIARFILPLFTEGEAGEPEPGPPTAMRVLR